MPCYQMLPGVFQKPAACGFAVGRKGNRRCEHVGVPIFFDQLEDFLVPIVIQNTVSVGVSGGYYARKVA